MFGHRLSTLKNYEHRHNTGASKADFVEKVRLQSDCVLSFDGPTLVLKLLQLQRY